MFIADHIRAAAGSIGLDEHWMGTACGRDVSVGGQRWTFTLALDAGAAVGKKSATAYLGLTPIA